MLNAPLERGAWEGYQDVTPFSADEFMDAGAKGTGIHYLRVLPVMQIRVRVPSAEKIYLPTFFSRVSTRSTYTICEAVSPFLTLISANSRRKSMCACHMPLFPASSASFSAPLTPSHLSHEHLRSRRNSQRRSFFRRNSQRPFFPEIKQ